jgi:uncharacterized membrane protein YtjA (UPF0391 family)
MFRVAIGLLIVAIVAAIFGFGGIAGTATEFAKIIFVVAIILAVVSFLVGGRGGGVIPILVIGGTLAGLQGLARAQDTYVAPGTGTTRTYERLGVTFGGGVGLGHIACDGADCGGVNEAGGIDVHVGGMLTPELALLLDAWGMSHRDSNDATFTHAIVTGALRAWLVPRLWVSGGIGFAEARWHYSSDVIDYESRSDTVPAVMGAIGVELLSSPAFALDLQLKGGTGFFEDDVRVRNVSLGVGVNWY